MDHKLKSIEIFDPGIIMKIIYKFFEVILSIGKRFIFFPIISDGLILIIAK